MRTGIDFGTTGIKLVRAVGAARVERITHVGVEDWDSTADAQRVSRSAQALRRLLLRLGLSRRQLGRLAVAVGGHEVSLREVLLPPLTETELRRALPYEARKQLDLEAMAAPVLDAQILARDVTVSGDDAPQMRVLLAALPRAAQDLALAILDELGLEPHVIDLEPLAALNELFAHPEAAGRDGGQALALLDIGGTRAALHIAGREGGLLSRRVGDGTRACGSAATDARERLAMAARIRETLTYFRGRHRQDVDRLSLTGGGAIEPGCAESLSTALGMRVSPLDPLAALGGSAHGWDEVAPSGPRFVTACGLCRWWDEADVDV